VSILCNAGYTTEMLGDLVRERGLLSLELAVKRLTSEPADFFGLSDRGRLKPGLAADLAIFDPSTVGSNSARPEPRNDLPGGGRRMVVPAKGMEYVVVNGEVLLAHGEPTGALPGRVLRPGTDIASVVRRARVLTRQLIGGKPGSSVDDFIAERRREAEKE
jgi:N-acyl-D-aspartate/D-glutamate deacylase